MTRARPARFVAGEHHGFHADPHILFTVVAGTLANAGCQRLPRRCLAEAVATAAKRSSSERGHACVSPTPPCGTALVRPP
jgi:hypothetical protein